MNSRHILEAERVETGDKLDDRHAREGSKFQE